MGPNGQENIVTGLLHQQGMVGNPGRENSFMEWDHSVNMTTFGAAWEGQRGNEGTGGDAGN